MNPLNHVAIIMDGNGRWGLKYKNSRNEGHKAGLNTVEKIIKETIRQKIKYLTLYAFSTENWNRPKNEINFLFDLLENFLSKKIEELNKDENISGILVQLPLPKHIDKQKVIESILPGKDVDGFHPMNVGNLSSGYESSVPCTPLGCYLMIKKIEILEIETA